MRVSVAERRARLAQRHRLAPAALADSPPEVAYSLVALHGTDPASVHLSIAARLKQPTVDAIERALYDERSLVRMLGMRRTVFVVPTELAPVVQAACTNAIAVKQRRLYTEMFSRAGFTDDMGRWLSEVEESTLRALKRRGEATAIELSQDEPRLKQQVLLAEGKPYEALQSASTRVLFLLAAEGRIVRGRPKGSWISGQFRWSPVEHWLAGGLPSLAADEAQRELVWCWLRAFGPGTVADLRWWTGLTTRDINRALKHLDTIEVDLDGVPGVLLSEDLEPPKPPPPWVALLPALDPTPMGWNARAWFLGEYAPILFDRSGNVGPTVWSDGRIVGGWAQRKSGEVVYRLLEDVGRETKTNIASAADALSRWIGRVRVTPRFRTPLERELSA
jgi:Winged helix DNA-binding domain